MSASGQSRRSSPPSPPSPPSPNIGCRQPPTMGSANLTDRPQSEAVIHRRFVWPEGIYRRGISVMAASDPNASWDLVPVHKSPVACRQPRLAY